MNKDRRFDDALRYADDEDHRPRMIRDSKGFLRREDLRYEFDCPSCDANNPWEDGFTDRSEVRCHYCGEEFVAVMTGDGRFRFKAL